MSAQATLLISGLYYIEECYKKLTVTSVFVGPYYRTRSQYGPNYAIIGREYDIDRAHSFTGKTDDPPPSDSTTCHG